ncbi:hypothetical protein [uncultured Muriicola sp.]|uniref:hypothetical protein n=1 Tax=uncultured Muriicola sp. TaxID=1583102 RepID=UPI00260C5B1D|nr:hypothetical protein [uncultured Muriicola sp.]
MAKELKTKNTSSNDEIDLGQLFQMIGKGFNRIFRGLLSLFLYFKRNAIILIVLAILGALTGFGLNQIVSKKMKSEVIVSPNLQSKNYLYDVVAELQANIEAKDTVFFKSLGIDVEKIKDFEIEVAPVSGSNKKNLETEMKYLELLQSFENSGSISDIVRAEILDKSSLDQRITFFYKDASLGDTYARILMEYINSNTYYKEIVKTNTENAQDRIKKNDSVVQQINVLITNYSKKMLTENNTTEGRIVLDNEQQLNVPELFTLKNNLIRDTESKKLELERQKDAITIINFGKPQRILKPLYQKNIFLFPLVYIGIFFLISFIKYLNKKALEMGV